MDSVMSIHKHTVQPEQAGVGGGGEGSSVVGRAALTLSF